MGIVLRADAATTLPLEDIEHPGPSDLTTVSAGHPEDRVFELSTGISSRRQIGEREPRL